MAATEDNSIILGLDDEVEGERIGSDDYCFIETGEPVPIKPGDDAEFDPQNPPSKPLSVSERSGLIFVAHSTGFCVARTKDIIDSSKEIAEKGSGLSIKELSVVDVPIGQVYILALSADSSSLAACIDGNIHFFSVPSLLNKDQSPFFSCSLNNSSCVKDLQWTKKLGNYYAVLSNQGNLYYGAGQDPLKFVMDNVDAFDWSVKGNLVAVARKNTLSIMSSKLKEKVSISLSFELWIGDSELNSTVKVDSIRWVRPDSIILGCFQLTSDGKEENYLVQVITSKDGKFTDTSSKPIVLSFSDVFEAFIDDIVPFGSGPYMSLSYLNTCELAITANRKSTDQHIVLFGWSLDDKKEAAVIDTLRDTLCPKIALQDDSASQITLDALPLSKLQNACQTGFLFHTRYNSFSVFLTPKNGDDNIVLGLCVDRISQDEKVEVQLGAEYKELSPFCILLCLSLDGKLFMYQVASVTGPSVPSNNVSLLSDEEDDTPTLVSSDDGKPNGLVAKSVQVGLDFQSQEVDNKELLMKEGNGIPVTNAPMLQVNSERLETFGRQKFLETKVNQDADGQQSLLSAPQGPYFGHSSLKTSYSGGLGPVARDFSKFKTQKLPEDGSSPVSFSGKFPSHVSSLSISTTLPRAVDLGKELPEKLKSASPKGASSSPTSNAKHTFPVTSDGGFSVVPPGSVQSNPSDNSGTNSSNAHFPGVPFGNFPNAKQAAGSSTTFSSEKTAYNGGQITSTVAGTAQPLPANRSSVLSSQQNFYKDKYQPKIENSRAVYPTRPLNPEPHLSKQFGNVGEMIKELETLLECIEGAGGFRDACTVLYESSVLELEEGMGTLLNRCRLWTNTMDEQLGKIQLIHDNTMQVLARKVYMKGIIKQATDGQYLDLWNRQKLSSELELKQQHISKVNQELTNQLIELERHLNTLELKKFGENDGIQMSQRAFPGRYGPSRNVQSLHSLQNTMISQLAAAEQLSECLTKQMAVLSIEPPPVKTQNVRRELFEEIGIPYNSASFSSPEGKVAGDTHSNKKLSTSSCSNAGKCQSRRNQPSAARGSESETARRRRDSLDWSWASFEPPKTTVKRVLLHEDRDRSAFLDKKDVTSLVLEGSTVAPADRYTTTSTLLYPSEEEGIQGRPTKQASVFSSHSVPVSSNIARRNNVRWSLNPTANLSSNGVTIVEKPNTLSVNDSESIQGSLVELHQTLSVSKSLHGQTLSLPKKPSEISDSSTYLVKSAIEYGKHHPSITKNSFMESGKGLESPFYSSSVVDPAPKLNPEVYQSDTAASKSHSGRLASSSPMLSTSISPSSPPVHSSLPLSSSLPNPTEKTSSLPISIGRPTTSLKASTNGSQTTLLSQSSGSSSSFLSSVSPYKVPENAVPSAIPIPSMNCETVSPKRDQQPPIPKLSSTTEESSTVRGSSPKNEPGFTLKLESSLPFRSGGEPSANLQSGSKLSFDGMSNPTTNAALNAKPELSFTNLPAAVLSGESSNVAVTQEDEMEEEAPETSQTTELTLGSLGSFGIGLSPNPTPGKPNPFGGAFGGVVPTPASSPFSMTVPTGELFRPASFSFQSPQPFQPSQLTNFGAFPGGLSTGTTPQISAAGSGFGRPAQLGSGQQALGSVLGAFGQSRQLGGVVSGTSPSSASGFGGGLISSPSTGGFAASTGGGFAGASSPGGGFAAAASASGGFAAAASTGGGFGGGFGGIASAGGGFAATASAGGGFAGAASGSGFPSSGGGGFGAFNSQQGSGGFSAFGSSAGGTGRPPSSLFTQMRK